MDAGSHVWRAQARSWRSSLARSVVLGLAATVLVVLPGAGDAQAGLAKPPACPQTAPDAATARQQAAACQGRVEVLAARTEHAQVFANASGTFTSSEALVVQRVRTAAGGWTAPDPVLRKTASGAYAPAASWLGTTFSGGGHGPLVTLRRGTGELSLFWSAALPAPVVSGRTATYPEVLPGVDLQLTAEVEGYSEVLVVKTPQAARLAALESVRFRTATKGLTAKVGASGAVSYVDAAGAQMFASGAAAMWDSSGGVPAAALAANTKSRTARMPVAVEGGDLVVRPDLGVLRGAGTQFPLFIDPAFNASAWTMINSRFTTQEYWSYDRNGCPTPYTGVQCAKVGYTDEDQTMIYRSAFRFPTSAYVGKHVIDAKFSMDLLHSWQCYNTRTSLWLVGGINSGTNWSNHASTWSSLVTFTDNHTCNKARVRSEWGVTGLIQTVAGQYWGDVTIGLRAGDEANHNAWKKFDAGTALLTVTYNSYPNAPDQLTVSGSACATGAGRPVVKTVTPELRARTTDADGTAQIHSVSFYWWPLGGSRTDANKVTQGAVTPGTTAIVSVPPGRLSNDVVYQFQAQSSDGTDLGQNSGVCEFKVDTAPPGAPAQVTSTDYPSDGQRHGGAGIAGTFKFFPPASVPSDFAGYAYTLDTGTSAANATKVAQAGDNTATVSITPPTDDAFTLRVWTRDTGGSFSATPLSYAFSVKAGAGPDARWRLDEGSGSTAADASNHGNTLTITNPAWTASRGGTGKALSFNGTNTVAVTSGPIATKSPTTGAATTVRTDANFTVSAWVKVDTLSSIAQYAAVSQDGTRTSAWTLSYNGAANRWQFTIAGSDIDAPVQYAVPSNAAPTAGRWTYLVATYDTATHQMRLYVDGVVQTAVTTVTGGFNATGPVVVGRHKAAGGGNNYFNGSIDDVRVFARVVPATDPELTSPLNPEQPIVTFPNGSTGTVGQPLQVTLGAGGDPAVTAIKYSLGAAGLGSTATLPTAGGQVTVTVTPPASGDVRLFAQAVAGGRVSDIASALIHVGTPPAISGTVVDPMSGDAVAGATVTLRPGGATSVTDAFGVYQFTGLVAGTYTVSTAVGGVCGLYASTQVDVTGQTYVDLLLYPQSDVFGYACTPQDQSFVPAEGNVVNLTGDDVVTQIGLPFAMPFYGQNPATAWVSTNGFLSFADPSAAGDASDNATIPQVSAPNGLIAPYWSDLVVDGSASVRTATVGTVPDRQFIVEWRNVRLFSTGGRVTFEAVLSEHGDITFNYADLDNDTERGAGATVGIESPGGEYGLQYLFEEPKLQSGKAVVIGYPADAQPIGTGYVTGTVSKNGAPVAGVTVSLQPQGLSTTSASDGTYSFGSVEAGGFSVSTSDGCAGATVSGQVSGPTVADLALMAIPDDAGYACSTVTRSFVPAEGSVLALSGDDTHEVVALPFPVTFYGQTYTSVYVSTNGVASFTDPLGDIPDGRAAVPDPGGPNAALYPYWNDLILDGSSSVRTAVVGTAPGRQFVIEWRNAYLFGNTSQRLSFEVLIGEQGAVTFNYSGLDNTAEQGAGAVVGIENATGTVGHTYCAFRPVLVDNRAIVYTPPAA